MKKSDIKNNKFSPIFRGMFNAGLLSPVCAAALVFLCSAQPPPAARAEVVDRIVAVVNDDIISLYDLRTMYEPYAERIKSIGYPPEKEKDMLYKLREDMIDQLIEQKLTEQESRKAGISVNPEEVDQAIERMKQANSMTGEEFEKALAREGFSVEEYRKTLRLQILRNRLVNREVMSRIVVTREDIENYYNEHPEEFQGQKQYHLRTILIKVSEHADTSEKMNARMKIEDVYRKLEAGRSFPRLAAQYSDGMADSGGDLGYFPFERLSPTIQDAIKDLEPGEYSDIIFTDIGYQVFFLEDVDDPGGKSLEEASQAIKKKLMEQSVDQKIRAWLDDLREESHIRIIR